MFSLKYLPHRKPNEKIIYLLHRHWFVLARIIFSYIILALIPLAAYFFIRKELNGILENEAAAIFLNLLVFSFYLFWWLLFYHSFLDYFLDIWIVTNHRVINIEQRSMFNRVVAEHRLFRIQDVVSHQKGILATFFNYGEIHIQTAGSEKVVVFEQVSNPHYIAREIHRLIENHKDMMERMMKKNRPGTNNE